MTRTATRTRRALAVGAVTGAALVTACQPGTAGGPCVEGAGHDGTNLLACRDGRWEPVMTLRDFAERAAGRTAAPAPAPAPLPASPLTSWHLDGEVFAIAVMGGVVYLGGDFRRLTSPDCSTSRAADRLVAIDGRTGAPIDSFRAGTDGPVRALYAVGGRLLVGGAFTRLNGEARDHLAEVDRISGAVSPWAPAPNGTVRAIARGGDRIYLGGDFTRIAGAARAHLAAFDVATGALDGGFAPAADGGVNALAVSADGGRIYVGGTFSSIGGTATGSLATVLPDGSVERGGFDAVDGGSILDLAATPDGGVLVAVGGDPDRGLSLDAAGRRRWTLQCDGDMQAVHWAGQAYLGFHRSCGGNTDLRLLRADPSTGAVDVGWTPTFDRFWGVRDLAGGPTFLVVAGDMTRVGGVPVGGFAIFRS